MHLHTMSKHAKAALNRVMDKGLISEASILESAFRDLEDRLEAMRLHVIQAYNELQYKEDPVLLKKLADICQKIELDTEINRNQQGSENELS